MSRKMIIRGVLYFLILVVIQIPLLHNWVLFDLAFPFHYIGFILLLPPSFKVGRLLVLAFIVGLVIDIFSNTPGVHASASVVVAYLRMSWLGFAIDSSDEEMDLTITYLGTRKFTLFVFPLVFIHHFILFTLENEGFRWAGLLFSKILWSSLFSYFLIWLTVLLTSSTKRRR